jgi:5-methylcytosine-specific restriction protein A
MTPRKSLSPAKRKAFFKAHGGICYLCGGLINPVREAWQVEHYVAIGMGGTDTQGNRELVHAKCHLSKSRQDVKDIALAKRRETKNMGATPPPRRPIQSQGFPKARAKPDKLPMPPRRCIFTGEPL